jgi:ammonium transporter Rh
MYNLIQATFCATSMVVALGAVLGKIGFYAGELLFFVLVGTMMWCLNYFINVMALKAVDPGGAMTVHLFGAMYGVGATFFLSSYWDKGKDMDLRSDKHHDLTSNYTSDVMALIGTIFLWVTFPSWNGALAPDTTQHRVVINTFLGIASSCVVGFVLSRVFRRKAFDMRDIQTVTYVGGIALGSAHSLIITPAAALLIGGIAASTAMVFDVFVVPYLESRASTKSPRIYDTRHVLSFHGVPGFIGGVASIIAVVMNGANQYGVNTEDYIFRREVPRQAGFQTACLFISIGIGFVSGLVVGMILNLVNKSANRDNPPFSDENHFLIPLDFPRAPGTTAAPAAT